MVSDEQSQAFLSVFRIIAVGTSGCCDCRYYEVIHETDLLTLRIFVCYEEYSVCQWGWFHHQGFRRCIKSLRGSFLEKEGIPKKYRLQVDFDRHHYFSEHSQRKRREEKDQRARREKREKKRQEEDAQYLQEAQEHLLSSLSELDPFFSPSSETESIVIPTSLQSTYCQLQTVSLQTRSAARDALSQMRHLRHALHRLQREASSRAEQQRQTEIAAILETVSRLRSLQPAFRWMRTRLELAGKEVPGLRTAGEVASWREKLSEVEEGMVLAGEMEQLLEGSTGGRWREALRGMFDEGCERCGSFAEMKGGEGGRI